MSFVGLGWNCEHRSLDLSADGVRIHIHRWVTFSIVVVDDDASDNVETVLHHGANSRVPYP